MGAPNRRIGILGGVFDPVHCGHLSVAVLAKESFGLERLIFIPSGAPPHKSSVVASPIDRLNMLRRAVVNVDGCEIWDGEIKRDGYSYTVDTLRELNGVYIGAKFYFIMGADNLAEIHKWRSFEEIVSNVTLCVTQRPGYAACRDSAQISANIETFPGPEWGSSSTMLRDYLKNGHSCKFLIPDAVIDYIAEKGLYGYTGR